MKKLDITIKKGIVVSFDLTNKTRTPENPLPEKVWTVESARKAARGLHLPPSVSEAKASLTHQRDMWHGLIG